MGSHWSPSKTNLGQTASPPPRLKNRYRLTKWLGAGSMGVVYRAYDETLDRVVAIKFLLPEKIANREAGDRFLREARTVARLTHPHIMALYDVDCEGQWHYLVLEYIPGQNLQAKLTEQDQAFVIDDVRPLIQALFEALAYANTQNLVHRDIKPENMMITPEGQLKVTDFGLALAHGDVRLTKDDVIVGTALYLAPEVVAGGTPSHQSDLYAAGAVLYELLTGQPPFISDNPVTIFSQILNAPLTPPHVLNPAIPSDLEAIVLKLLEKEPAARYESASIVLAALPQPSDESLPKIEATAQPMMEPPTSSLLERIIRTSSTALAQPTLSNQISGDEAPLLSLASNAEATPRLTESLLVYAALEDTVSAVEAERKRLSELLQDNIVETLNLLLAQASTYEQTLATSPYARMAISVISSLVRQVIQDVRDLGNNLHPATLEALGLEPALEGLATQVRRSHGLTIYLNAQRMSERLSAQLELALFRAAQDAVDRVVRQAQASEVTIDLQRDDTTLQFSINDNGLNPGATDLLQTARQRLEQLGGQTEVVHQPTTGLSFKIQFTLDPPVALTPREMDVIRLLTEGLSNKEIAIRLSVTPRTVNFHLDNLYGKLGVNSRTEAAIYALRQGWSTQPV